MSLIGKIILIVGDSWIAGASGDALVAELQRRGAIVTKDGIVGSTAIARASNPRDLTAEIAAAHPTDVVYVLGVNDTPGDRAAAAYRQLVATTLQASPDAVPWVISNATLENSMYRTRVQQIEQLQRDAFGRQAIAGSTFASPGDFDSSHYHLTSDGAQRWGAFVADQLELRLDTSPVAGMGRGLLRLLPGAEGFLGRFGGA
jgi:lysophospholipase L1-like esterase